MRRKVLALLGGTVAGLVVVEGVLRMMPRGWLPGEFRLADRAYTGRARWEGMMVGDRHLGYRYRSGLDVEFPSEGGPIRIRTVAHGLGDIGFRDLGTAPPFDVVFVGDSFAFCDDVEAERCWVRHFGVATGARVGSLGVSGYSTLAEARVLDLYGRRLQPPPAIVVLSIFPNDFDDNVDFDAWARAGGENFWEWRARREGRGRALRWLAKRVVTVRLVDATLRTRGQRPIFFKNGEIDLVLQPWWFGPLEEGRRRHREAGWVLMRQGIGQVRETVRELGAALVLALIPTKEEVYFEHVRRARPEVAEVDRPYGALRECCAEEGLLCCDLLPTLREEAAAGRQLYLRISSHWNDTGHAVGAEGLRRCLEGAGLLARVAARRQ